MNQKQFRIGIDVGGTFTDAVIIDNKTLDVIAMKKTPTTHDSEEGVAKGIITIIRELMEAYQIQPEEIVFISHGTTQATNALLEGDVAKVGIIGMGDGASAKTETNVLDLELAQNKYLQVNHVFIPSKDVSDVAINNAIDALIEMGSEVIVASEAFSIEKPEHEEMVIAAAKKRGYYATGGYQISQLFGLKLRTRTAVVNGSLIPKMMETSDMTEKVIKDLGIKKDLMIMRADGGVMTIDEVRKRPILTMLSGLAAGIAGAIMHEKISEGVFLEIGGTSTDISVIKDGQVMIKNASVGGHKTYLKSVDVQTTAIAGGTMIRSRNGEVLVGPRSAHLAHLPYECFDFPEDTQITIERMQPKASDPDDYVVAVDGNGKRYAFTVAGAANYLGYIDETDYSCATSTGYKAAWEAFAAFQGTDPVTLATECLDKAAAQVWKIVQELIQEYELEMSFLSLYGGGGSAGVLTHYLGKKYDVKSKVVNNAPYISTIGVALAMITETIERSVVNPNDEDIKKIRTDIIDKMLEMGALRETIEVAIEVDSLNHILIANATGTNEINANDKTIETKSDDELKSIAIGSLGFEQADAEIVCRNESIVGIEVVKQEKKLFGMMRKKTQAAVVLSGDGIVKYRRLGGELFYGQKQQFEEIMTHIMDNYSSFSDAGQTIPELHMFVKYRSFDYSGLMNKEQVEEIATMDLEGIEDDERIIFLVTRRG
ncbi:hydantoinase/oxoprolinase family protein [Erysipelothrix sp. HDW6C]|uniref:hydantoinase/oxoprolinase family protein n=1 Tax=Erysipelothrix sp. HDW6C TaxID=2714930 RepID=UPI00140E47A7|nr:hydantoinase/oxoprolinase family protein [Erysipelothrix sp. HDW6C]QIK68819.1 hydantoinase/oxoprolinase family protein [Erysipelothrix sp. HDW6C]